MTNTTQELLKKQPEVGSKLKDLRDDEMNAYEIYLAAKKEDIITKLLFFLEFKWVKEYFIAYNWIGI